MPRSPLADFLFNSRRLHAIQRAKQRYGVQLDNNEYAYLNARIRKQKCPRVADLPDRRAAYRIEFKGRFMLAVYSHHEHQLITFLPPGHRF